MPSAVVLIADGSEEIEFVTTYDVLKRAGYDVKSVGVELKHGMYAVCSRDVKITPDIPSLDKWLPTIQSSLPDIILFPGGAPGAKTFCDSKPVLDLVQRFRGDGKWTAFICAATTVLVKAAEGREGSWKCRVTSHPSVKDKIVEAGWEYSEERAVVDGKVITSRGPGTALLFALTVVECMMGKEKRDQVAEPMIVSEKL